MNLNLLAMSAASLCVAGSSDAATPSIDVQRFLILAQGVAQARLADAEVDLSGRSVAVRGSVGEDGRILDLHVVRSSGSVDTDLCVERALARMSMGDVPARLGGASMTLLLGANVPSLTLNL